MGLKLLSVSKRPTVVRFAVAKSEVDELKSRVNTALGHFVNMRVWGGGQRQGELAIGFGEQPGADPLGKASINRIAAVATHRLSVTSAWEVLNHGTTVVSFGPNCFDRAGEKLTHIDGDGFPRADRSYRSNELVQSGIGWGDKLVKEVNQTKTHKFLLRLTDDVDVQIAIPMNSAEHIVFEQLGSHPKRFQVSRHSGRDAPLEVWGTDGWFE